MREPAPPEEGDDLIEASLRWLEALLWGGRPRLGVGVEGSDYLLFPGASRPHLLIPLTSRSAAARCILQSTTATRVSHRMARKAISTAIRVGLAQRLLRTAVQLPPTDGSPDASLPAFLQQIVDRQNVVMA